MLKRIGLYDQSQILLLVGKILFEFCRRMIPRHWHQVRGGEAIGAKK